MVTANELLNNLSTTNSEDEGYIVIGIDRHITVPNSLKKIAVEHDHNIETVTFKCPRYWDEHDLSKLILYINYRLPNGEIGSYIAKNINVVDDNSFTFTWTIRREVTKYKGNISFLVCAKSTELEGDEALEILHWNTELCTDVYISEGLEAEAPLEEEYPDIVTQLLERMTEVENVAVKKAEMDTFANALKGTASGSTVHIDDVSPVTHDMKVSVRNSRNNLFYQSGSLQHSGTLGLTCTYDEKNQEFTINGTQQDSRESICLSTFSIPNPSATLPYTICRYKTAGTIIAPSADVNTYLTKVSITDANISCPNSSYYDADFAISSPYKLDCSKGFGFIWNMGDSGWNPTMGGYTLQCYTAMSIGNLTVVSKRNGDGTSTVLVVNNNSTDIVVDTINSGNRDYAAVYGTVIASKTDVPNNNRVKTYRLDVTPDKKLSLAVYYNSKETFICTNIDVSDIDFSAVTFGIKAVVGNSMGGVKYTSPSFVFGDEYIQSWLGLGLDDVNKYYREFYMRDHDFNIGTRGLSLRETYTEKDTEQIWSTGKISEAESYDLYLITCGAGTVFDNYKFKIQIEQSAEHNPYAYVSDWTTVKVITTNTDGTVSAEYTPNADGTVEGVKSLYPTTILSTDTDGVTIDCEYNRDINKAFAELTSAIISLGGNV